MATKTHVAVSYGYDSASDTTDDESSGDEAAISSEHSPPGEHEEIDKTNDSDTTGSSIEVEEEEEDPSEEDGDDDAELDTKDSGSGNEGDQESEDDSDEEVEAAGPSGLANVMAKILNKKTPEKKSAILAKAKSDRELQWKKRQAELKESEEADGKSKSEETMNTFQREREKHIKRKQWEEMCHIKPHVLDREKERQLQRVATRGVVQLFNAVKKQQKLVEDKLKLVGSSEIKRERVMKSVSKCEFLDMLKGSTHNVTSEPSDEPPAKAMKKQPSENSSGSSKPNWSVLRDDFMMGGGMKDWDKEDEEEESDEGEAPDMEDSSDEES